MHESLIFYWIKEHYSRESCWPWKFCLILDQFDHLILNSQKWISVFINIQIGPTKTAPLLINPIEMRVLWTEIKYIKNAPSLLNRDWVNKRGLDLSKEVLWASGGQRTAKLQVIKVGDLKKILPRGQSRTKRMRPGFESWTIRSSSKFNRPQLCSPSVTYRDSQYLFWKI